MSVDDLVERATPTGEMLSLTDVGVCPRVGGMTRKQYDDFIAALEGQDDGN